MLYFIGVPVLVISCVVFIWRKEIIEFLDELLGEFE